ncbi:sensor histidine kinase [Oceanibacterium hippocampi]|uniref:histidine kinase n=1 Tax=Oceanibacterium hippocampi TaxID=745714 RepID=A0A1Y5TX24_9PROT|nr:sensor histidine kinase [Oceanibacterium hippocampi]SLN75804.1 Signal-transduction histidine kinase senX3 [Oceanibacterium hippocampi]
MTHSANLILAVSLIYVALLFCLAWFVDRRAARGRERWLHSPVVYTLSLSVYCTAWTFYGAVGSAARSGLEFATIYLGPTLVFVGWWWLIRKIVRIGRTHRITSIADMISSRYGKSGALAAIATLVAVMAATPYIALQLQSVTLSFEVIIGGGAEHDARIAFWTAVGMAVFTILFGTRTLDENERHYGVVAAIAAEAIVKLTALIAVGMFAIFGISGGLPESLSTTLTAANFDESVFGSRWVTLLFLSAAAIICLPRQFQVTVVENTSERQLVTASWMFPFYLLLTSAFVLPIAGAGLATMPSDANPDLFVLTLPLSAGKQELAILAFIGGFSSATSMVIVSTIALSTMVSNHIIAPISMWLLSLRREEQSGDVMRVLLMTRRFAIVAVLGLGYLYFILTGGSGALASIGLIAFCGVAQFLPSLIAGIFWRGATKAGAMSGLLTGFVLWTYTLFLPSFDGTFILSAETIRDGLFGIGMLRPHALAGFTGADPLVHATFWSVGANAAVLILVSLFTRLSPLERLQGTLFVDVFRSEPGQTLGVVRRSAATEDLFILAQRILGRDAAAALFASAARAQGKTSGLPDPSPAFISRFERELAGSVGAASAHAMVNRSAGGETISLTDLMDIADEAAKLMRTSQALAAKSREAEHTAAQLRAANERLRSLDMQKDEFLSQVSHELRTPMTSVRSFAEILEQSPDLDADTRRRFAAIIQKESIRLTSLLDEIRDMSFLHEDADSVPLDDIDGEKVLDVAVEVALAASGGRRVAFNWGQRAGPVLVRAHADRLSQVFINLISNAIKHNNGPDPAIRIDSRVVDGAYEVAIEDNGPGIPEGLRERVFERFFRHSAAGGAGLGLPISLRIMQTFGGSIGLEPGRSSGARFIIRTPLASAGIPPPESP